MNKKGIIFDLDGTLWEVTNTTYKSVNEITKKYNLKEVSIETIKSVFGCNKVESAQKYFPYLNIKEALKLNDEISAINICNLKQYGGNVYENLEETLQKLIDSYDLFIVSNTDNKEYIESFLTTSKLTKYFTDYLAASELNIAKSEAIQKIIEEYNLSKSVYVGDTIKDQEASEKTNIPFIQATYGFGENLKTKYSIASIKELPSLIDNIFM
ncbi:MAG TPA: HAD family hydrolase [Firmicutes bacterium]|nr:HAD family hydrolase [Bacillota bacterium]